MTTSSLPSATHPALATLLPPSLLDHSHPLRVTSQASLNNLVGFSLGHLRQPSPPPLVLHCLPSPAPSTTSIASKTAAPPSAPDSASTATDRRDKAAETSIAALPKLVSVCEIIKREWFSVPLSSSTTSTELPSTSGTPPSPSLRENPVEEKRQGLHQYTLLTTLEALELADPERKGKKDREEEEMEEVESELVKMNWLTGGAGRKKRPRRKHSPCMIIVLSPSPLSSLTSSNGWTHQPPSPPPKTKKRPATSTADGDNSAEEEAGEGEVKQKRRRRRRKGGKEKKGEKEEGMDVDDASHGAGGGSGGEEDGEE